MSELEENKETTKIKEIAHKIAHNFTDNDIWICSKNNMRKPEILAFMHEKYHAFLSDIDEILITALYFSSRDGLFDKDYDLQEEILQELNNILSKGEILKDSDAFLWLLEEIVSDTTHGNYNPKLFFFRNKDILKNYEITIKKREKEK